MSVSEKKKKSETFPEQHQLLKIHLEDFKKTNEIKAS